MFGVKSRDHLLGEFDFVSYRTRHFGDKVGANFQLNIENIGENGRLQPIGACPDGTPNVYRIVDLQ